MDNKIDEHAVLYTLGQIVWLGRLDHPVLTTEPVEFSQEKMQVRSGIRGGSNMPPFLVPLKAALFSGGNQQRR